MKSEKTSRALKHPILKNVEYCSIIKNRKSVLEIAGSDIEGKSWRDFQIYLGDNLPITNYNFSMKFKNDPNLFRGNVRAVTLDKNKTESTDMDQVIKAMEAYKEELKKGISQGGISYEMLLSSTKSGYETQISFLNQQLIFKDSEITRLRGEITELEIQITELNQENTSLQGSQKWLDMLNQYKPLLELGLMRLGGKAPAAANLAAGPLPDYNIPTEILNILNRVDYDQLQRRPDEYQKIIQYLNQYVSLLPQKNQVQ